MLYPAELPGPTDVGNVRFGKRFVWSVRKSFESISWMELYFVGSFDDDQCPIDDPSHFIMRMGMEGIARTLRIPPYEYIVKALLLKDFFDLLLICNICMKYLSHFVF